MPARPMPLELTKPDKRPADVTDGAWMFPERLLTFGSALRKSREELAALAGVNPSTITRWLQYKGLGGINRVAVEKLETGLLLPRGTLLATPDQHGKTQPLASVADAAVALGLDGTVIEALLGGGKTGDEMKDLGVDLRRAILGAVHLLGYPLESAIPAARKAHAKNPTAELSAESWLAAMREFLPQRPASGTFPSSSKIKLG